MYKVVGRQQSLKWKKRLCLL